MMRSSAVFVLFLSCALGARGQVDAPPAPADSMAVLEQRASQQPPVKGAHRELGLAYYRAGKLAEAEHAFEIAMAEDAADLESVQMRGVALYRLNRPAEAIPFLERVHQWMPHANADANHLLGLAYLYTHRYDDARSAFAAQYGVPAQSASAWLISGQMFWNADLLELATQNARKALEIKPGLPLAHFLLGEAFLYTGDLTNAQTEFEKERQINPGYAAVYDRLGDVYTRAGHLKEAQEALTQAISMDITFTGPFIQMGKVFLRQNDPQSALMYLLHAEKMDPGNFMTHTLLGQAYRAMGKEEDARRELNIAGQIHRSSDLKLEPVK